MSPRTLDIADLGWKAGDHVCGFYTDGGSSLDDIVMHYVSEGLHAGDKCVCLLDSTPSVRARIPEQLLKRKGILQFVPEDEAYLPDGNFSKDVFIRWLEGMVKDALSEGYEHCRLLGETSFLVRNAVDMKAWFACEAELNEFAARYPQFFMCLYNLDHFDGERVMYVLQTHRRVFVNGIIIPNPHYIPTRQFLGSQ
jgi:MEDS: MEthanogen/methylotroph, DcmR Sensory domain